jgi:ketopantoate reductase
MSNNGSNPRLDRIEKLIQESERANKEAHARHEREIVVGRVEFKREIAESSAKFDREMAKMRNAFDREMTEHRREMNADLRKTRQDLRRWAAVGVKEARRERVKTQEIKILIGQIAAAQLVTEEKLATLISSLGTAGNGGPKTS